MGFCRMLSNGKHRQYSMKEKLTNLLNGFASESRDNRKSVSISYVQVVDFVWHWLFFCLSIGHWFEARTIFWPLMKVTKLMHWVSVSILGSPSHELNLCRMYYLLFALRHSSLFELRPVKAIQSSLVIDRSLVVIL